MQPCRGSKPCWTYTWAQMLTHIAGVEPLRTSIPSLKSKRCCKMYIWGTLTGTDDQDAHLQAHRAALHHFNSLPNTIVATCKSQG